MVLAKVDGDASWLDVLSAKKNVSSEKPKMYMKSDRQIRKRSLHKIMNSCPPERELYPGSAPGVDRESEKARLQDIFCGRDSTLRRHDRLLPNDIELTRNEDNTKTLLKTQIEQEIQDRLRFVKEIGECHPYKKLVEMEIEIRQNELCSLKRSI